MEAQGIRACSIVVVVLLCGMSCAAQHAGSGAGALAEQDGRLNGAYKELVEQMAANPPGLDALRHSERDWIRQRDLQCGKDVGCLTGITRARADQLAKQVVESARVAKAKGAIPAELWGKWTIRKVLPTETISCWDDTQARKLVGTELEYSGDGFRWKNKRVRNLGTTTTSVAARQFAEDNSGGGASDSQVTFQQLGISTPTVKEISIQHPDLVMGAGDGAGEMPGETVLMKAPGVLIFSVCNVYFEAHRPEMD